jgi:hypothetical protein
MRHYSITSWSRRGDLNPRPSDYESLALPLSYAGIDIDLSHKP